MNAQFNVSGIELKTERLILREWKYSDLDDFYDYASVEGVGEMAGWPHHKNKEESLEILKRFIENKKTFAIVDKKTNKAIGSVGVEFYGNEESLIEFNGYKGREIGYVLSKDYWGNGIMVEAVKTVIDYLFNVLDYDFLLCGHYDKNNRSKRVQEKCGFMPYRRLKFETRLNTIEEGILRILINPNKNIKFNYSHPETLIINE